MAVLYNEAGAYARLVYLPCKPANGFVPEPPQRPVDVIYLCSPNNPTGAAATREQLEAWVKYAREHEALILFDAAYEAYISDPAIPHSIYEIPGAREVAIEFRSFSKNGGFTGVRCGFIVVPKTLLASTAAGARQPLRRTAPAAFVSSTIAPSATRTVAAVDGWTIAHIRLSKIA